MDNDTIRYGLTLLLRVAPLVSPAILMLAGGLSPVQTPGQSDDFTAAQRMVEALYPDNWPALVACSILICVPGIACVAGADYLAEITFARVNLNTTPSGIWVVVGYALCLGANWLAIDRLIQAW